MTVAKNRNKNEVRLFIFFFWDFPPSLFFFIVFFFLLQQRKKKQKTQSKQFEVTRFDFFDTFLKES